MRLFCLSVRRCLKLRKLRFRSALMYNTGTKLMNKEHKIRCMQFKLVSSYIVAFVGAFVSVSAMADNKIALTLPALSLPCKQLFPRSEVYQDAAVMESGSYCLGADFLQKEMSGGGHSGPGSDHGLIRVRGGDVVIDLQKHTVHTDASSSGVTAYVQLNKKWAVDDKRSFGLQTTNITIKNGTIDLRGIGTGVRLINRWDMTFLNRPPPANLTGYEKTRFVLENLTIKTDNVGIQLEGDGNIIRNCTIESGGDAAIMMAGPNGLITNNTIVLTNPLIPTWHASSESGDLGRLLLKLSEARKQTRAAIVLHHASDTVISGNRIEVKGKSETRHSIYINNESKNVAIEKNIFIGGIDPVVLLDGSSMKMGANMNAPEKLK